MCTKLNMQYFTLVGKTKIQLLVDRNFFPHNSWVRILVQWPKTRNIIILLYYSSGFWSLHKYSHWWIFIWFLVIAQVFSLMNIHLVFGHCTSILTDELCGKNVSVNQKLYLCFVDQYCFSRLDVYIKCAPFLKRHIKENVITFLLRGVDRA